jgi:hypothetical protein
VTSPTDAPGLEPNPERGFHERADLHPHGSEARARWHRRRGEKPLRKYCARCADAENAVGVWRRALKRAELDAQPAAEPVTLRLVAPLPGYPVPEPAVFRRVVAAGRP